jgi:hypothetical protein
MVAEGAVSAGLETGSQAGNALAGPHMVTKSLIFQKGGWQDGRLKCRPQEKIRSEMNEIL